MARQAASGYLSSPAPTRTMRMRRKTRARPFRIPSKVFLAYQSPPFLLRSVFRMSSHKNWNREITQNNTKKNLFVRVACTEHTVLPSARFERNFSEETEHGYYQKHN